MAQKAPLQSVQVYGRKVSETFVALQARVVTFEVRTLQRVRCEKNKKKVS